MSSRPGGSRLLNLVVLLAMLVTAIAFTVGLAVNSGVDLMASAVAGGALFMVMASSHFVIMRELHASPLDPRLQELEEAVIVLDTDLQRFDGLQEELARVQVLTDRIGRLERQFEDDEARPGRANLVRISAELQRLKERHEQFRSEVEATSRSEREQMQTELRSLEALIQGLAAELVSAASARDAQPRSARFARADLAVAAAPEGMLAAEDDAGEEQPLALDLEVLDEGDAVEGDEEHEAEAVEQAPAAVDPYLGDMPEVIEETREEAALAEEAPVDDAPADAPDAPTDAVTLESADLEVLEVTEIEEIVIAEAGLAEPPPALAEQVTEEPHVPNESSVTAEAAEAPKEAAEETTKMAEEPALDLILGEPEALDLAAVHMPFDDALLNLRRAIRTEQIAPYLSPIIALKERTLRYAGAVPRMRQQSGAVPLTEEQWRIAREDTQLPRLDALILGKCIQFLRDLPADAKLKAVFVPISAQSLLSSAALPALAQTLEENNSLAENIYFEFTQSAISELGQPGLGNVKMLGKLGFCFCLKEISDFDLDYAGLRDYFFRFIKIDAGTFLHGLEATRAPVVAADMVEFLDRYDLKLIAGGVSDERTLAGVGDYGIDLAEGPLLGVPLPLEAQRLRETEGAKTV